MTEVIRESDRATIKPDHDITSGFSGEFKSLCKGLVDSGVLHITIDLAQVEMIDSIGLGLLIAVHNTLIKQGEKLAIVNASEDIVELLTNMRLNAHFAISGSARRGV